MTTGGTRPTPPPLPAAAAEPPARHGRRGWLWIVALLVVAGLVVAAWFIAESIARDLVVKTVRQQFISQLALPADQKVDVTVEGTIIPQLIAGRLDDLTISSQDAAIAASLTGDVTVHATGLVFRGEPSARSASASVVLDEAEVRALMSTVENFPADTLALETPNVTSTIELSLFGARFPIGIALTPSAGADGDVVLSPASVQLGEATITAKDLRSRFGSLADTVLRDWNVCIAQYLPAALTVTGIAVRDDRLVADLRIDPRIIDDPALQANGVCS